LANIISERYGYTSLLGNVVVVRGETSSDCALVQILNGHMLVTLGDRSTGTKLIQIIKRTDEKGE
jgi:hypothetical protein